MKEKDIPIIKTPLAFLVAVSKPYRAVAFAAIAVVVLASALDTSIPYFFKRIIDAITNAPDAGVSSVWLWAMGYVAVGFFGALGYRLSGFFGMRWSNGARASARSRLSAYITKHSHHYFADRFAGSLGSKINNASNGVSHMVGAILWGWLSSTVHLVISIWLVFYAHTSVGIIFVLWLAVLIPFNIWMIRKKIPLGIESQEQETGLRGRTVDMLTNITAVLDYARRSFELSSLGERINARRIAGIRNWTASELILLVNTVVEVLFVGGMIAVTVYIWSTGNMTAGSVILVLSLIVSVRGQLTFIGMRFNDFAETWSETKEGMSEVLIPHEVLDAPLAPAIRVTDGEIVFDNVSFQYAKEKVFDALSLHVAPGERVGLVGRSGVGKTTLMNLITRQYDVISGKILIDGQDISMVKQESLREAIAVVPQEPLLFHRSLEENIRYGKLNATEREVRKAARLAEADTFIQKLPSGYDTLVGDRGVKLSGGERQRIAIARAFLKDARILLLDEATSSLDSASEAAVQEALEKLMEGKTVIAVAHRLSTLGIMDRIVVLDGGLVVEDGTHKELLKLGGIYAELWSHQAGGFIQDE